MDESMPEQRARDEMMMALAALGDAGDRVMETSAFDLRSGLALDWRVGWDLSDEVQLENARKIWRETMPSLLVLSPVRLENDKSEEMKRKSLEHLRACMEFAKMQIDAAGFFLFEQPWEAWSWSMPEVLEVLRLPEVQVVEGHLCAYERAVVGLRWRRGRQVG